MAEIALKERCLRIKLVYYGGALCGKTTNLQQLHQQMPAPCRSELVSVNSFQDRTVLFDTLPLRAIGPRGFDVRVQLVAVPGQAVYALSRRVALKGADGVVFVANSAADRRAENVNSLRELRSYLQQHSLSLDAIPLALQYNKRDLPSVMTLAAMEADLNPRHAPFWLAVASRGDGVVETFRSILLRTARDVFRRYPILRCEDDATVEEWVAQAMVALFPSEPRTAPALAAADAPTQSSEVAIPAESDTRVLHVSPTSGRSGNAESGLPTEAGMAEAYADACTQLARAYGETAEERSRLNSRLADVRRALYVTEDPLTPSADTWLPRMLSCLAEAAEAAHASFVGWAKSGPRLSVLPPLRQDPLASNPWGLKVIETLQGAGAAQLWDAAERPDLRSLMSSGTHAFAAVAAVPMTCAGRTRGVALLYFLEGDRLPGQPELEHLTMMGALFAPSLHLALMADAARQRPRQSRPLAEAIAV